MLGYLIDPKGDPVSRVSVQRDYQCSECLCSDIGLLAVLLNSQRHGMMRFSLSQENAQVHFQREDLAIPHSFFQCYIQIVNFLAI